MKIFNKQIHSKVINICGQNVAFSNCVAEVSDEFGQEILSLGIPDFYEYGKQPAYETPKEVAMKADFSEKEAFYQGEILRYKNQAEGYKKRATDLEIELKNWKGLYEELQKENIKLVASFGASPEAPVEEAAKISVEPKNEGDEADAPKGGEQKVSNEDIISELQKMTKAEILSLASESGIDMEPVREAIKTKMIEYFVNNMK